MKLLFLIGAMLVYPVILNAATLTGGFVTESAEPKYGTTWVSSLTCRASDGRLATIGGGGSPWEVLGAVRTAILQKALPIAAPLQPLIRSESGDGGGNRWNDNGTPHLPTLQAACIALGFDTYVSSTCLDEERSGRYPFGKCNFHTPENNQLSRFTGHIVTPTPTPEPSQCRVGQFTSLTEFQQLPGVESVGAIPTIAGSDRNSRQVTSTTIGDMSLTVVYPGIGFALGRDTYDSPGRWIPSLPDTVVAVHGTEDFNVTFSDSVYAFGFEIYEPANNDVARAPTTDTTFRVTLRQGETSVGTFTFNAPDDTRAFVGASSAAAFDRIEIRDLAGTIDNEYFLSFWVSRVQSTQTCDTSGLPNLTVSETRLRPADAVAGTPLSVEATVRNSGAAAAPVTVTRLLFDQNVDTNWNIDPFTTNTTALAVAGRALEEWANVWTAPAGTHRLQVCADATNVVVESDETDNCRVLPFVIPPTIAVGLGPTASFDVPSAVVVNTIIEATSTSRPGTCPGKVCDALTYQWQVTRLSDGANVTPSANASTTLAVPGDQLGRYQITLVVTDGLNRSSTAVKTVTVVSQRGAVTCPPRAPWLDVNGDGSVTAADATAVTPVVTPGSGAAWQNQTNRSDVTGDGNVTPQDGLAIANYVSAGLAGPLPVCTTPTPSPSRGPFNPGPIRETE